MSRFEDYLTETFDTNVNIKRLTSNKGDYYMYRFLIGKDIYEVEIFGTDDYWEIYFKLENSKNVDKMFDITGTGNAYEVFSGVLKCIKDFIKQEKPDKDTPILFSAKTTEPSRIKLYNKLIKTKAKSFGYKLTKSYKEENEIYYELGKI